jgi:hypothetical protein
MASLDKSSVRHEVKRLKADFEQLCAAGKIPCESQAIMTSLFLIVELILAIFLEKTTSKNTPIPASLRRKRKKMNRL